jgi:hypothetical protein
MSNAPVIAAVTTALSHVIATGMNQDTDLPGIQLTTMPPDKARDGNNTNQINIFLYQTVHNAAWRNLDVPQQVRAGETGSPPLALNLYYIISVYGKDNSEVLAQRLLGRAMAVLHDQPLLNADAIRTALGAVDAGTQIERVRFAPQVFSLEDMSKLWMTFQTQYRLSAPYLASVVLIDSQTPTRSPLPVLTRGKSDQGVFTVASGTASLDGVTFPFRQSSARLGDDIEIDGENLSTSGLTIRFTNPQLPAPIVLTPQPGKTIGSLKVHLPSPLEDPTVIATWTPGFYFVEGVVQQPNLPAWTTNEVAMTLAPVILVSPTTASAGTINLTVTCTPRLRDGQRVLLLFGDGQISPQTVTTPADTTKPTTIAFVIPGVIAGNYTVRLRVDGVDSIPLVPGKSPLLGFDPAQQVKVS